MSDERRSGRRALQAIALFGLLSAAFFAALPWFGCAWNPVRNFFDPNFLGFCTFGFPGPQLAPRPIGLPGFGGPYWGNLIVGLAYLVAAVYVAISKRL
jgi:hypothetical protein